MTVRFTSSPGLFKFTLTLGSLFLKVHFNTSFIFFNKFTALIGSFHLLSSLVDKVPLHWTITYVLGSLIIEVHFVWRFAALLRSLP